MPTLTLPAIDEATFSLLNKDAQDALLSGIRLLESTIDAQRVGAMAVAYDIPRRDNNERSDGRGLIRSICLYDAIVMFPREVKTIYPQSRKMVSVSSLSRTQYGVPD